MIRAACKRLRSARSVGCVALALVGCSENAATTAGHTSEDQVRSRILDADSSLVPLAPEQRVVLDVSASATRDSAGQWVYEYRLRSDEASTNDVDVFALVPVQASAEARDPEHWTHYFYNRPGKESALLWAVTDLGTLPDGYVDTGNVAPSEFDLRPGQGQAGFAFTSPHPPSPRALRFFATGFDTLPNGEDWGDEDPTRSEFEEGVTGLILGPSRPYGTLGPAAGRRSLGHPWPDTLVTFTVIDFELDRESSVRLEVLDGSGRNVRQLASGRRAAGSYAQSWDGSDSQGRRVPKGRYDFRLIVDGRETTRRACFVFRQDAESGTGDPE